MAYFLRTKGVFKRESLAGYHMSLPDDIACLVEFSPCAIIIVQMIMYKNVEFLSAIMHIFYDLFLGISQFLYLLSVTIDC